MMLQGILESAQRGRSYHKILNVETILHELSGTKYFTKIDLKSAFNQIRMDEKFKGVTTMNSSIFWPRRTRLPYRVKTVIFQKALGTFC